MANTKVQLETARWIRENWLPEQFGQEFLQRELPLTSGGRFRFDGVGEHGDIVVTISTSGAFTAHGRQGAGKLQKIRADALFLLLSGIEHCVMVFTEVDMLELCRKELRGGRLPKGLETHLADIPAELRKRLEEARLAATREVSPAVDI